MMNSSRLSKCSEYFQTCLAERWTSKASDSPCASLAEFVLETHDTDVAYYKDCFARMTTSPSHMKDFKDVKYSLELLKVASQIQFHELVESILLYLSVKTWSDADAAMIRFHAASPDFPRQQAQELLERLGMAESEVEECSKQVRDVVEHCIRTALRHDIMDTNLASHRAVIDELLRSVMDGTDSRDVVMIVCREAKAMLLDVAQKYEGQTGSALIPSLAMINEVITVCWILEAVLAAGVGEEVVQCFVHLHAIPELAYYIRHFYFRIDHISDFKIRLAISAANELARAVLGMYRKVAAGKLLLKTPERVALLKNWHLMLRKILLDTDRSELDKATKNLFSTLPFKEQMEVVKSVSGNTNFEACITTNSLAKLLIERSGSRRDN